MHGANSSKLSEVGLTELMTRCITINRASAAKRLNVVARHLPACVNPQEENEIKRRIFTSLSKRSVKALAKVVELSDLEDIHDDENTSKVVTEIIQIAEQEQKDLTSKLEDLDAKYTDSINKLETMEGKVALISKQSGEITQDLEESKRKESVLNENLSQANRTIADKDAEINRLKKLSQDKDTLRAKQIEFEKESKNKKSSISWWNWVIFYLGLVLPIVFTLSVLYILYFAISYFSGSNPNWPDMIAPGFITIVCAGGTFLLNFINRIENFKIWRFREHLEKFKNEKYARWEVQHPAYHTLQQEIEDLLEKCKM